MLLSARNARRVVAGVAGAGAVAGAMLFGAIPSALADDPANNPQLQRCRSGRRGFGCVGINLGVPVHPSRREQLLHQPEGLPREEVKTKVHDYLEANPQTKAELTGIRQPLVDLKNRCGEAPAPSIP